MVKVVAVVASLISSAGAPRPSPFPTPFPSPTPSPSHDRRRGPSPSPVPMPPPGPTPPANSSNVWPQDRCQGAVPSADWPSFDSLEELQADTAWASYFEAVYGEVPQSGYPICTSSLTWISSVALADTVGQRSPQGCSGDANGDFLYVDSMSACCDPGTSVATFLWNANNIGWAIPSDTWVEVMHIYFPMDKGHAWYYTAQGSAVWLFTGNTKTYKDHPDGVLDLLNITECHDQGHKTKPATECEGDFEALMEEGISRGYDSVQFTDHYDCNCGSIGPSSWDKHASWCQTEIIDLTGDAGARRSGCASSKFNYRAGWNAQAECSCDDSKKYTNCQGFGIDAIEV